ncbi:hypothetical protein [Streptomyces sp. 13K301]|uniref:Uncharacterized protein n=1 Tax=Streptomyces cahuitamycinicus TaxID=2070367 RepID=A0A2N8TRD2_9ACTN|nr:hypothetical protein C1J00_14165 [Streptomyces cahuitamycinicus]
MSRTEAPSSVTVLGECVADTFTDPGRSGPGELVLRALFGGGPAARPADPDRIGQHGLEIVKAVTKDLFTEQEPVGKRITARIALSDTFSSDTVRR